MTFDEWITQGIDLGYCSVPACQTHEGLPSTEEEDAAWDEGWDPCVPAMRLYWPEAA